MHINVLLFIVIAYMNAIYKPICMIKKTDLNNSSKHQSPCIINSNFPQHCQPYDHRLSNDTLYIRTNTRDNA